MSDFNLSTITPVVYFIRYGLDGPIKIGKTNRGARNRLSLLQSGTPVTLHLLGVIVHPGGRFTERSLHGQFGHLRVRGEWFRPEKDLLEFIKENAVAPPNDPPSPAKSNVEPCGKKRSRSRAKEPQMSEAERRFLDLVSIRSGHLTIKDIAHVRNVSVHRVKGWIEEAKIQRFGSDQ